MAALEKHFTPHELAKLWGFSPETIRNIFKDTPGVLRVAGPARRFKREYVSLRIPESVAMKRHAELGVRRG
jgi:hypothetical protein